MHDHRITIKVREAVFETYSRTLERFPDTLLGSECSRRTFYCPISEKLIFDRNIIAFDAILYYYQSNGCLIRPPFLSMEVFEEECRYFRLNNLEITRMKESEGYVIREQPQNVTKDSYREKMLNLLEQPESSHAAEIYAILSMLLIVGSVILSCVITMPDIVKIEEKDMFKSPVFSTELAFHCVFAAELILRFSLSRRKIEFMKSVLNIIDILAILPYFAVLLVDVENAKSVAYLRVVRIIRTLRMLHFAKHSGILEIVIKIFKRCTEDFVIFLQCILVFCCAFGSLEYYIEHDVIDTQFISIPEAMWWALQTMLCLGYGDIVPTSVPGKILGGIVSTLGAISLTVPLLFIGKNYLGLYHTTFSLKAGYFFENGHEIVENEKTNQEKGTKQETEFCSQETIVSL